MNTVPTPFVVLPLNVIPKDPKHPVRVTDTERIKTNALTVKAHEARDALDVTDADRLAAYKAGQAEAVARIARGEAVMVPARPDQQALADAHENADHVIAQAETNETAAVLAYDAAIRAHLDEILPGIVATAQRQAGQALAAINAAQVPLDRAVAARDLALSLRASQAFGYFAADGMKDTTHLVPDDYANSHALYAGTNWSQEVPYSLREQGADAALAAYALAPPIADTAQQIRAITDALTTYGSENPANPWPQETHDAISRGLGRDVAPPAPVTLESEEEFQFRVEVASFHLRMPPTRPAHLGGMVVNE